ncbi:unnamed protein product [Malus baccata var. baccata]
MADPYIQKYIEPYIDRVAMVTKTHLDKLQERKCQSSSPCCKPEMEDLLLMIIFINSFMEQQRFDEVQGLLGKMHLSKNVCFQDLFALEIKYVTVQYMFVRLRMHNYILSANMAGNGSLTTSGEARNSREDGRTYMRARLKKNGNNQIFLYRNVLYN